jgi:hypothetical protein
MCGGESGAAAAIPPRVPALSLVAGAHLPGGGGASPIPAGSSSPPLTFFISHGELPLDLRMAQSAKGHQIAQRVRTAL